MSKIDNQLFLLQNTEVKWQLFESRNRKKIEF